MGEGARRCSTCSITYPTTVRVCRVCEEETSYFSNVEPDEDWEYTVQLLLGDRAGTKLDEGPEIEAPIPIHEIIATVMDRRGQLFVSARDVDDAGFPHLETLNLLQVGARVYEVMGYHEVTREYWVRPFALEPTDEDMAWLRRRGV